MVAWRFGWPPPAQLRSEIEEYTWSGAPSNQTEPFQSPVFSSVAMNSSAVALVLLDFNGDRIQDALLVPRVEGDPDPARAEWNELGLLAVDALGKLQDGLTITPMNPIDGSELPVWQTVVPVDLNGDQLEDLVFGLDSRPGRVLTLLNRSR